MPCLVQGTSTSVLSHKNKSQNVTDAMRYGVANREIVKRCSARPLPCLPALPAVVQTRGKL